MIGSFFFLLTSFLSNPPPTPETPHPQPHTTRFERAAQLRLSVKDVHLKKWMWPLGKWKWRPAGGGAGEGEVRDDRLESGSSCLRDDFFSGLLVVDARLHRAVHSRPAALYRGGRDRTVPW